MKADATDQFYNVGTGIRTSIKELAEKILEITDSQFSIQYEPSGLTFVKNHVGCPKKAEAEIGFKATTSLDEGLSRLIEWRRNHMEHVELKRKKIFS